MSLVAVKDAKVPAALLLNTGVGDSAKLLWICLQVDPAPPASISYLASRYGLTRHTIRRALAQLESAGWWPNAPAVHDSRVVSVPVDLLREPVVGTFAKILYGLLQLQPHVQGTQGQFVYSELKASRTASKPAITALLAAGWIETTQKNKFSPVYFTLRNPAAERRQAVMLAAKARLEEADYRGEALMREYLSLLVDSDNYEDNASPAFLVNPYTGEEMEFDRYYSSGVAFEHNGPQHYRATKRYPNGLKAARLRGRDLIKQAICLSRGIELVVIHPQDLSLEGISRRVPRLLPRRSLEHQGPLVEHLEWASANYRRGASKWT